MYSSIQSNTYNHMISDILYYIYNFHVLLDPLMEPK